jgi:hypothetical protein
MQFAWHSEGDFLLLQGSQKKDCIDYFTRKKKKSGAGGI